MRIGIDIDDVLADTVNAVCAFHNETYGTCLKRDDFLSYKFWETWGGSKEEAIKKMQIFNEEGCGVTTCPIDGALRALTSLKNSGYELFAVTARPLHVMKQTEEWIGLYFPDIFSAIKFGNTYGNEGIKEKKSSICKSLNIGIIIEDDIDHAVDCAENGIKVILLDCPWNQGELSENVHRVFSWDEALRFISLHK
ncbi:MAG: hypothetical protein UT41_C0001G0067 [Candidatus Wolfebacteria bacterium GW2011_GWC2_39_22]|uniref:Nucleotidase n=1 Tax=Candidatus Wolfebacteria bacterium GW2011_GWC2_39_22 TaxID=1619013 RepID=A0A0G0NAL9_9BACT|nr:MAG: hypothetical protein UT41_C0001G0067 [Candidatus Wolfebacteria bacterium GW2011_GWC2_39_22]HBI25727.1 hypothetical protein [Candidatus Wolfebacteria bacterium]